MDPPATPQRITSDVSSPASRKSSQNFHPYMIQSTSSSLLTRSNSSPTQPVDSYARHRPSRSMSSLSAQAIVTSGEESEDRRRSLEARPTQLRRSGTLPAFPPSPSDMKKQIILPANPKQWTPSELATYLVHTLTTGEAGDGHTLPPVLVEDIRSWVLRQQVNGRTFLRGGDQGWGSSQRPPPFLPLLLSLSRKLRRATLQGRILTMPREPSFASSNGSEGAPSGIYEYGADDRDSVLLEETENASDDDDEDLDNEDQILGVKKLVKDFDMRGSASEASGDEAPPPRRGSFTTEWRKDINVTGRRRKDSSLSAGGMADGEMSPIIRPAGPVDIANIKTTRQNLTKDGTNMAETSGPVNTSPPPPYASPNLDSAGQQASPLRVPTNPELLSAESSPVHRERTSPSPTPTPPRPKLSSSQSSPPNDLSAPDDSPHMAHMQSHERSGSNPYFALRRSASGSASAQGPRLPTLASLRENAEMARRVRAESSDSEDELRGSTPSKGAQAWDGHAEGEDARWTTARRVTLRPNAAKGLFEASGSNSSPEAARTAGGSKRERKAKDEDMERKMGLLLARIHELEERLQSVEAEKALDAKNSPATSSILAQFGLGSSNDGLPSGLKGLPAYLFLVGIGVGVVVVKVLLGRKR